MSKPDPIRITRARRAAPDDSRKIGSIPAFTPASPRARHDGWTPERQVAFIEALAECGCVAEACERVGITHAAAYRLRRRVDAYSFRAAWDAALDYAIRRLSDAVFSRALNGVTRPVFFQGEQVGERRYFDERLAMFLLRYRDPDTYGAWRDRREPRRRPDAQAIGLDRWTNHVAEDAWDGEAGFAVDRAREADPTDWLTDEEAAERELRAPPTPRPTPEETDAVFMVRIAAIKELKARGIDPLTVDSAEFERMVEEIEAAQAREVTDPPPGDGT